MPTIFNGTPMAVRQVDSKVGSGGSIREDVVILITRAYLESATNGISLRIYGKRNADLEISKEYVAGFLMKLSDFERATQPH